MEQSIFGVILRAENKERTKAFYEKLGLEFGEHKHGKGPLHFASEFNGAVLEIYQGRAAEGRTSRDYRDSGETTLYIELPAGMTIEQLGPEIKIIQVIRDSLLVVLEDPDGRAVMVSKAQEKTA